jgi:hypothetical protein
MPMEKFDLNSLLVSQEVIATETVAKALQGLVSIIKETGEIMPSAAFNKLDNNGKILAYFLGLRARALLGFENKRVAASAEEIANLVGLDVQRAREYLSRLKKGNILKKTADGWELPATRIAAACDEIINKRK